MGVFSGDTFCVSGAFSISQNEMKELVIKNGAHIATTPNKSCTYLVADIIGSSKTMKAEKDGIAIVTEEWVQKSIKAGKKSTDASLFLSGGPSGSGSGSGGSSNGGGKKKSKKQESEEEEEEDEEEEEKPKKKPPAAKKSAGGGGSVFSGETFCVSGSFSVSQAEMRKLIITNGGDVVDTPNKKCTYLVADSIGSSKTMKAQKDGIKIVTEEWVNDSIAKGKMSTDKKFFLSSGDDAGDDHDDDDDDDDDMEDNEEESKPKKKRKAKANEDEDDDEEEEDVPKKKSSKKSATSGPSSSSHIKKVIVKGSAPVDDLCPVHSTTHVYSPSSSEVYDCMLNQTDIGSNANKFYVIQLLESDHGPKKYSVWTRWGRVGYPGQNNLDLFDSNVAGAIKSFEGKFYDKTKNRWTNRSNFESVKGKYTLLERDYSADHDDEEDEEDAPKVTSKLSKKTALKNSAPTIKKSILWIDPNNLANNKEHLDAVGIDNVESVGTEDEAIAWLKNEKKHRLFIFTQIKIVTNMARMESGVFQPQAGIATTIKLNQMGVPFENILVYTSEARAKGKFPPNVRITYDDAELTKFLVIGEAAKKDEEDDEDEDGEKDEDDDAEDDESVTDPKPVAGSIKLNPLDPSLSLSAPGDVLTEMPPFLFTNYKPAASTAPIGQYRPLCINTVDGVRVYLFDARPENRASIQLFEDAFAALVKHNETLEQPLEYEDFDGEGDDHQFTYYPVESVEWLVPNEPSKYQTHAEAIAQLKELERSKSYKYNHVTVVNSVWNYEKLKKQLSAEPLSIDSAVCKNILDYLKSDSPVHSPSFIPRIVDKKYDSYHVVCWNYEDNGEEIAFLDGRPSNNPAIERIREVMGEPFESQDCGYTGGFFTQPNQPVTEAEGRALILRQRISAETSISFHIGQFRTNVVMRLLKDGEDGSGSAFVVLGMRQTAGEDVLDSEAAV